MSEMTPEEALAVLMALRGGDADALLLVPGQEDLPSALVALSDLASTMEPPLAVITGRCRSKPIADSFVADALPLTSMGEYALHLVRCASCRTLISAKGVRSFGRSKEMLRQALKRAEKKSDPEKAV